VEKKKESQKYYILLIITDGAINDMDATIEEIVNGNDLPLSIVIVGVGDADFTNMNILDADDNPLKTASGKVAKRDIVQVSLKTQDIFITRVILTEKNQQ
jgi:hypothetical protein